MNKIVIVGGVAGGATAAARIRRLDENAQITVFERSGYISYANCGLPYYIGGVITDREELTLQTPEGFWERFRIDMRVHHEVIAIHPGEKNVSVRNLDTGKIFEAPYDKLLLAPGARPTTPALPGMDSKRLFTLRTVEDTLRIREFVERERPRSAALIGGGFIGLELAENLWEAGVDVTVIQRSGQVLSPLDGDMAAFVHAKLRARGVGLMLGRTLKGFEEHEVGIRVLLRGKEPLRVDLAILAVGVTPESFLAKDAGLLLGARESILVNERMETSEKDIYAVGDAVQIRHFVSGEPALIALAGPANKQARIAADNICGGDSRYDGAQGSSVIKLFDTTVAFTGLNEKTLRGLRIDYDKIYLSPMNHAGYYPGGRLMTMKILFEKETFRLLGAQIVGRDGVDKRIDVLSTAMRAGMTAPQLTELDLAYAPPYSSAKDPVNMAGFMIENLAKGVLRQFHWHEIPNLPRDGSAALVDVRTREEFDRGHIEGFVNIPVDELRQRLGELTPGKPAYVMCQTGLRSYIACRILQQNGFDCYNLSGGYRLYQTVTLDKEAAEKATLCGKELPTRR